jgi:hypothetical protein
MTATLLICSRTCLSIEVLGLDNRNWTALPKYDCRHVSCARTLDNEGYGGCACVSLLHSSRWFARIASDSIHNINLGYRTQFKSLKCSHRSSQSVRCQRFNNGRLYSFVREKHPRVKCRRAAIRAGCCGTEQPAEEACNQTLLFCRLS